MSRTEDEERTPLVYEDRVGTSSGIETEPSRRRRRYICLALTTICLGVGVVLAVALPISLSQGKPATNPVVLQSEPLNESMTTQTANLSDDQTVAETRTSASSSSSPLFGSPSSSSSSASSPLFGSSLASSVFPFKTSRLFTLPTFFPPDPFSMCPNVPQGRRSTINLDELNGKLFFEFYRVQTLNSPAYASEISCSVMELDFPSSTNAKDGTMTLKWMQSGYISRYPRTVEVKLEGDPDSPNDWMETVANKSNKEGRLSLLVQVDGYLLTYECFPNVTFYPHPAYAIHLYSMLPVRSNTYMATALLNLANVWGLNPADEHAIPISHAFCPHEKKAKR